MNHSKNSYGLMEELLDRLDDSAASNGNCEHAELDADRHFLRLKDVRLVVDHPGGTKADLRVCTHFVSAHQVGVIAPSFIHIGTRCELHLPISENSEPKILESAVVQCKYEEGGWHSLLLTVRKSLKDEGFVNTKNITGEPALSLRNPAVVVSGNEAIRKLFDRFIQKQGGECKLFDDIGPAFDTLASNAFELVIIDISKDGHDVNKIIQSLRDTGYRITVVLILPSGMEDPDCGQDFIIHHQPIDPKKILMEASQNLLLMQQGNADRAIKSSYDGQADMADLLDWYREHISIMLARALKSMRQGNIDDVVNACHDIRQTSPGFGYQVLSDTASEVLTTYFTFGIGQEVEESFAELCELGRSLV